MARTAMTFTLSGDKELRAKLQEYGKRGVTAAMRGVRATAVEILEYAKNKLSNNGSHVTGKLFNSGKVAVDEQDKNFIDVTFSGGGDGFTDYAEYVEFGRRAGKAPPYKSILEWIKRKGIADTYNFKTQKRRSRGAQFAHSNIKTKRTTNVSNYYKKATGMAIAIAKSIGKKGTKARPFLFPAFEAKKGNLTANIQKEFDKLNKEMTR